MKTARHILAALTLATLVAGCCTGTIQQVDVVADAEFVANTSVKVDIIGVTDSELEQWRKRGLSKYRTPADAVAMTFGQGLEASQSLSSDHEKWADWQERKVRNLYVIALIPGMQASAGNAADPRIAELPLDRGVWDGKPDNLTLSLRASGLRIETPRK